MFPRTLGVAATMSEQKIVSYYVDATNGNDSNNGLGSSEAWLTIAKVNGETFNPSDRILFKRGETWESTSLRPPSSGSSGNPITFGAYGSGNRPIISRMDSISGWDTAENWTDEVGDVWSFSLAVHPRRLWLSSTEYPEAETTGDVDAADRWAYDAGADELHVYATENPSTFYSDVESSNIDESQQHTIRVRSTDYITFQNLDIRGSYYAVLVQGSSGIQMLNCTSGLNSTYGLLSMWYDGTGDDAENGVVANCTIESGYNFSYAWEVDSVADAIKLWNGSSNWLIHDNVISNWGHTCIQITGIDTDHPTADNLIYDNEISSPNTDYCRAFEFMGNSGLSGNKFYRNNCHDLTIRSQLLGPGTEVYNNLFYDIINSPAVSGDRGQGISLQEDTYVATDCKIYFNTFANIASQGIRLYGNSAPDMKNNLIRNNILYNCGNDDATYSNIGLRVTDLSNINTNTFENNQFYGPSADVVNYRGTDYTVAEFEANLSDSDVAADNLASDPDMVNPGTGDFHLQSASPGRGQGKTGTGVTDDYDNVVRGSPPDIGAYEYITGVNAMAVIEDLQAVEVSLRQQVIDLLAQVDSVAQVILDLQALDDQLDTAADVISLE